MKRVLSIFDYYQSHETESIDFTITFLKRKKVPNSVLQSIGELGVFLENLRKEAPFTLSNNGVSIDALALDIAIKSNKIADIVALCKEVKADLFRLSDKDDFLEFKQLYSYWDMLELAFASVLRPN